MDYSQSVLQPHHYENLGIPFPSNASLPSPFRMKPTLQASSNMIQISLLLLPSAVLLLVVPIRAFQLHRASLKVLPNYTGAVKAVGCSKGSEGIC
jgi:hypothetical protein